MASPLAVIGISAAIELIRFVQTSRDLKNKTPEEVLEMWAQTRLDVHRAVNAWLAAVDPET